MGIISAVLGLVLGVAFAVGLKSLLGAVGFGIPASGTVVKGRSIVVALIAGSASPWSWRSHRRGAPPGFRPWPPCGPPRSTGPAARGCARSSACSCWPSASPCSSSGCSAISATGWRSSEAERMLTFLGVAVLGPIIAGPISRVIGAPVVRFKGVTGRLARAERHAQPAADRVDGGRAHDRRRAHGLLQHLRGLGHRLGQPHHRQPVPRRLLRRLGPAGRRRPARLGGRADAPGARA